MSRQVFSFPTPRVLVRLEGNSAIIVGPHNRLKKLRDLEGRLPVRQGEDSQNISRETPTLPASARSTLSIESRLQELKALLDKDLITPEEYEKKQAEIMSEL